MAESNLGQPLNQCLRIANQAFGIGQFTWLSLPMEQRPRPRHLPTVNSHWVRSLPGVMATIREISMITFLRAGVAAALLTLACAPAGAADKAFQSSDLDQAAIKLEAQIKEDAGSVAKPVATLRQQADAAFQKHDFRTGMVVLGQMVAAAPNDAASWLRLANVIQQIRPREDKEKALLLDRASTAAYVAYRRAQDRTVQADSLALLGRTMADRQLWRPALDAMRLSLTMRETADLRGRYEQLRVEHGFPLLRYHID